MQGLCQVSELLRLSAFLDILHNMCACAGLNRCVWVFIESVCLCFLRKCVCVCVCVWVCVCVCRLLRGGVCVCVGVCVCGGVLCWFSSSWCCVCICACVCHLLPGVVCVCACVCVCVCVSSPPWCVLLRSEEHTSELQSHLKLVC